jgi:hypothetical protein
MNETKNKNRNSDAKHGKAREKNGNGEELISSYMKLGLNDLSPPSHTLVD